MASFRSSALVLLGVVLASACGKAGDPCRNVLCATNRICDPLTGGCIADTTPKDAGTKADAGTPDAGTPDAGTFDAGTFDCLSNAQCTCPAKVCNLTTHTCVAEAAAVQPVGEACADAPVLVFPLCSPDRTTFQVNLAQQADNERGSCSSDGGFGRDAVVLLNVAATSDVKVSTAPAAGSNAEAVTYLRRNPCATGPELACYDSFGQPGSFRVKSVAAGVYALVIDAFDQRSSGAVDVTVELLPGVTNDTCSAPLVASVDGGAVRVDLSGANDDLVGTCNATTADSRDAVWQVNLSQTSDFHAVVRPLVADAGIDSILYLRSAPCATGSELNCTDNAVADLEHLRARGLAAGTYYLVVEGYGARGSGPVELTTWATAPAPYPANDTCLSPRAIDLQTNSSVRFVVDTSEAEDNERGTCSVPNGGGREVVYSFTLAATKTVTVTTEAPDGGQGTLDTVLYLRAGTCSRPLDAGRPEVDCADDDYANEVMVDTLDAGQYFLFVDSYRSATAGPTIVTVTRSP